MCFILSACDWMDDSVDKNVVYLHHRSLNKNLEVLNDENDVSMVENRTKKTVIAHKNLA